MKIRVSTLVNIILSIVLVVSITANFIGAVDYDPWLDVTNDGYGGMNDVVSVLRATVHKVSTRKIIEAVFLAASPK